ncbi:MAG TPA: GAF domain-containing protein [Anaerolineales bacterium]|nr:GAF domain-containing protein [Anaerolineales bacterium]
MNSTSTPTTNDNSIDKRAVNAFRTAIILAVAFVGTFGLYLFLISQNNTWQFIILSIVSGTAALTSIIAIFLSRRKQVDAAAIWMIAGIMLLLPAATLFLSGVGLVLGIGGWIGVFMVATLTLTQPKLNQAIYSSFLLGVIVILLDVFPPFSRLDVGILKVYIPVVAFLAISIFAYYIAKEFSSYPLRAKLIGLFLLVAAIAIVFVAVGTNVITRNQLTQLIGLDIQRQADRIAGEVLSELEDQVQLLQLQTIIFEPVVRSANSRYPGDQTTDQILANIQTLDDEWRNSTDDALLIFDVLNNPTSDKLREFQILLPEHAELFVTDQYGANIAATNRTSDYYQADEEWWRAAYNNGKGSIYIGQPEFDESSQALGINIAVPIYNNSNVSGILRSTIYMTSLSVLLESESFGNTGEADLRFGVTNLLGKDNLLFSEIPDLNSTNSGFGVITYQGQSSLVSQVSLPIAWDGSSLSKRALAGLGWRIIVHQDVSDAYEIIDNQVKTTTLISLGVLALAALLGYFASQLVVSPIVTLTNTANIISSGDLTERSSLSTNDEIGTLAKTFNSMTSQLQDTLGGLERRVAERTADVELERLLSERRAQELQSISEISRAISTEQRLDILLPLISRLVSERFDFYHAGIFFIDDTGRFAYLQAANSEGGQNMLARGHRLEVGKGLVGTVAKTGKPRIVLDVGADAAYFDNPDLPETRSEMALPLNIRGKTIGVLDVQSTKPGAFTENDASTLGILGDQVAIAIENARLFGQTQQAREEAEALYSQIQQQVWANFSKQVSDIGYRQTSTGGKSLEKPIETDETRQALKNGQVVVFDGKGKRSAPTIAVPVKLRGQTLGVLNIKSPTQDRKWNQDEINLAQAISDRLALALDNARLLHESQRRAAKEAKIGEVSAKIGASINMRNVLEIAVEELGRALPGSDVVIQFEKEDTQ